MPSRSESTSPLGLATELGVILLIIYTPAGHWLFDPAPVDATVWLLAVGGAVLMWVLEEGRKLWLRQGLASNI